MIFSLLTALFLSHPGMADEVALKVNTPRGKTLEVILSLPENPEGKKLPALVAAPGKGYHMNLPIFQELRARGAEAGYAVYTFNWNYYTEGRSPSEGYAEELEDLQAVYDHARADAGIDPAKVIISGKSLGSVIAYRAFSKNADTAFGLHLLTPICDTEATIDEYYPGLAAVTKPVTFVFGMADEACSAVAVKKKLGNAGASLAVVMVPGAHSFELGGFDDPAFAERNASNVKAVVGMIAQWARAQFGI